MTNDDDLLKLVPRGSGPYCNDGAVLGRARFSHPAYLGAVGKQVLDWAWEDRGCVKAGASPEGNQQAARMAWYARLLSPRMQGAVSNWKHGLDASGALALEDVYLGAIEGWYNQERWGVRQASE